MIPSSFKIDFNLFFFLECYEFFMVVMDFICEFLVVIPKESVDEVVFDVALKPYNVIEKFLLSF